MEKKIFLILIILVGLCSSVFAITINEGEEYVTLQYASTRSVQYNEYVGCTSLNIRSTADSDQNIDFNYNANNPTINIIKTGTTRVENGIPYVKSALSDILILSGCGPEAQIQVDSNSPTLNATISVTAINGSYNSFYSGAIRVTPSGTITDELNGSGIDNYIFYLVPVSDLSNYDEEYEKIYIKDTLTSQDINSLLNTTLHPKIPDGNYYVLIDANDRAGNYIDPDDVIDTNKNVYFDNAIPTLNSVVTTATGTITNRKLYIGVTSFPLTVILNDVSGISNIGTGLKINVLKFYNHYFTDSNYDSGYSITADQIKSITWGYVNGVPTNPPETGDIYVVTINAIDNVGNEYDYDFNIIIDLAAPTKPTTNTLTIEDVDKNVTISFGGSSDPAGGSGFKEYRVYKDNSTFSTVDIDDPEQEHVCTIATGAGSSCKDSDSKSSDTTIHYGVVGVDNAGNVSDANTQSIWTGPPACTVKINNGAEFARLPDLNIEITNANSIDDDVNEMSIGCTTGNATYVEFDDENTLNITSGSGCSATNGERTVYVRVRSEDYPTRFTICSDEIYFDNTAPTAPANLKGTPQADGSVKLTWTESVEAASPTTVKYKIYYSTNNNLTNTASYKESSVNNYTFSSNADENLYFKVSALDLRGNESALTAALFANVKKIGPRFATTIEPSNDINGPVYVNAGLKTINFKSDEALLGEPIVKVKQANDAEVTVTNTYNPNTLIGTSSFTFTKSGTGIIKVTGTNTKGEQATSEFTFTIDVESATINNLTGGYPATFESGHDIQDPVTYKLWVTSLPTDVFKIEYAVNNSTIVCTKQQVADYNCTYDNRNTPDGNHTMYVNLYDKALNKYTDTFTFFVDNIDEEKVTCDELRTEITRRLKQISDNIEWYIAIGILEGEDETITDKIAEINLLRDSGNQKYEVRDYQSAKTIYQSAITKLQIVNGEIPEFSISKTTITTKNYDANTTPPVGFILDQNVSDKTMALYAENVIKINRNLEAVTIQNKNFFSVTLDINNTSSKEKTITIIEEIPKSFATNVSKLVFNKKVEVVVKDPIIKYTITIPANSSEELTYRSLVPVTLVDLATKYDKIRFTDPILLDGNVSTDKLNIKKPINVTILIYLFSIIMIFVILVIGIGAISNYQKKKKLKAAEVKPDPKKMMSDYLGKSKEGADEKEKLALDNTAPVEKAKEELPKKPEEPKKPDNGNKFNEDYQYILSAIKKR